MYAKKQVAWLLLFCGVTLNQCMAGEAFLNASCELPFPESMSHLQELIKKQGYTVSRVQHVDKGLRSRGYETDLYRVVFFGKQEEIQQIRNFYPALIPYIPLSITIFEDGKNTGVSTIDPKSFNELFKSENIKTLVESWHKDVVEIINDYRICDFNQ
jgi:uncharacterized protein (DUF302 family)